MLFNKVKIGDQEILVCSSASINIIYWNIFHEDFLMQMAKEDGAPMQSFMKMAFVMAKMGELCDRRKVNKLTVEDYADWIEQFANGDLLNALPDIQAAYMSSAVTAVNSKKNSEELSGN